MTAATASHHPQLTIAEAAELVGVSRDTIRRMIGRGQLKAYRYGVRVIRIDEADLLRARRPVTSMAEYTAAKTETATR